MSDLLKLLNENSDLNELLEFKTNLDQRIEQLRKEQLADARLQVKQLAEQLGIEPVELVTGSPKKGVSVQPKYQDKKNSQNTWAGRGKHPKWLADELANGAKLEDFLIK